MADQVGQAEGDLPNLNLTSEEKRAYGQLFKEADPDGFGAVSGDVAVKFFEKTRLPPDVLGQIWQIADTENRGFLTPTGFGVVLRLIGHAQAGKNPTVILATQAAPLPRFTEPNQPPPPAPVSAQTTGTPASPSAAGSGPIRVPPLSPDKVAEYSSLFEKSGAQNGMLSGSVAKQIFERARLPNEVLGRIWGLADTQGRGSLDVTEFVVAMHLLASYKAGAMRGVPTFLPPGLYEAASRRVPPRMSGPARPGSAQGAQPSFSTYPGQIPQSPISRAQAGTPLSSQSTGDWLINPADKARFDQIFATVDKQGLGYINGGQAVEFFGNARLPEEVLAQIWDLADVNSEGRLDKDEFAVAMYLVRQQRGTKDGRGNLPAALPPALVPPSRRKQIIPPSHPTAPAFENAPVTQPRSAADDLFGLDVLGPAQPAPAQKSQVTGGSDAGPFATPTSPPAAAAAQASSIFKPFEPSSSFGRSLAPQQAGSPALQNRTLPTVADEDLLGDADTTQSSKLTNETAELGNLSNQVGTLSTQMTQLQGERAQSEQELAQNRHQKQAFETRLAQLRSQYEREVAEVKALKDQLATSRNDTKRLQQDIAMIEGTHADLQTQHQQLSQALAADQQENNTLKEKTRQLNAEIESLKPQVEKIKSDARQQKGLVAINKKQLATNESERDRLLAEITSHHNDHSEATRELEESNKQIEISRAAIEAHKAEQEQVQARAQAARAEADAAKAEAAKQQEAHRELQAAVARSPPIESPAASITSNPFMRRQGSEATSPPPAANSSELAQHDHSAFDNIFGPAFGAAAGAGVGATAVAAAAPGTSFRSVTPSKQIQERSGSPALSTPQALVPPAPPVAKQITSAELPLRLPLSRQDSIGSSVQVAAPASRVSPSDTPRAQTPAVSTPGTGIHARQDNNAFLSAGPDEEQESVREAVEHLSRGPDQDIPGAFPAASPNPEIPGQSIAIAAGTGIAATAVAVGAGMATVGHEQKQDPHEPPAGTTTEASGFDEYFGGPVHRRTASEQAADFDSAFASMRSGPAVASRSSRPEHEEFPDIKELDSDYDDSSVGSEHAPMGFDDDFNTRPAAAAAVSEASANAIGKIPEATPIATDTGARPQLQAIHSTASTLPGIEQQQSPPDYKDAVPTDDPNHFPREYKGLLPERGDPVPSDSVNADRSSTAGPNLGGIPPAYGPEVAKNEDEALRNVASQAAAGRMPAQNVGLDFDSAFADMGPAKVEDEDSDEDADGSSKNRAHEFDPSFDSPAQSRPATVDSVQQSPIVHHAVTNGTASAPDGMVATESFYNFGGNAPTSAVQQAPAAPVAHDWDALFAPLNSSTAADVPARETTPTAQNSSSKSMAKALPVTPAPASVQSASNASGHLKPQRPQPGRALSTGTEHDDPILKRLTSMGWSRTESLAALEKFDYNIDKAADYLTFRS